MATNRIKNGIMQKIGLIAAHFIINTLTKTVRIERHNYETIEKLEAEKKNYILAFWHGTMILPWHENKNKSFSAIVSQSKDGEVLTRVLKRWKYKVIRGSSRNGAKQALMNLLNEAGNGKSIAITPDGPTGPNREMKAGAVVVAKKTNVPLVLLGVAHCKKYTFKSWDKFEAPKFFSKVHLVYSDPIIIDSELDYDSTNNKIKECEKILNDLQERAESYC